MMNKIISIARREIRDTLRHKKVLMAILFPIFLYPFLMVLIASIISIGSNNIDNQTKNVAITGEQYIQEFIALNEDQTIEFKEIEVIDKQDIADGVYDSGIDIDKDKNVTIYYNAAEDVSAETQDSLYDLAKTFKETVIIDELMELNIDPNVMDKVNITSTNIAPPSKMAGKILGMVIPLMLIMSIVVGANYPAIDTTSGERERGTLETLFSFPVSQREILSGKFLAVSFVTLLTALANVVSLFFMYIFARVQYSEILAEFSFELPITSILYIVLMLIPFVFFVSSVSMAVSLMGKDFKESSSLLSYSTLLFLLPTYITMMPGITNSSMFASIPVINLVLNIKDILMSEQNMAYILICVIVNSIIAVILIALLSRVFTAEKTLFFGRQSMGMTLKREHFLKRDSFDVAEAMIIYGVLFLLTVYVGSTLILKLQLNGFLINQFILMAGVSVVICAYFKVDIKNTFALRPFKLNYLIGGIITTFSVFLINLTVAELLSKIIDLTVYEQSFEKLFSETNTVGLVAIIAFVPAICEEIVFRGLILSSFKGKMSKWTSVILTAVLFGIFHMNIAQFVTATLVGIVITLWVYESGSIFVGIICHAMNNAAAMLMPTDWLSRYISIYGLSIIGVIILVGFVLLNRFNRKKVID